MQCYQCTKWKYNDMIERRYGEGTGLCGTEPKGCNRAACLAFEPNKKVLRGEVNGKEI